MAPSRRTRPTRVSVDTPRQTRLGFRAVGRAWAGESGGKARKSPVESLRMQATEEDAPASKRARVETPPPLSVVAETDAARADVLEAVEPLAATPQAEKEGKKEERPSTAAAAAHAGPAAPACAETVLYRETQLDQLLAGCECAMRQGESSAYYVYGQPGNGKTMVIRALQARLAAHGSALSVEFQNAMVPEVRAKLNEMRREDLSPDVPTVMIVDEVDQLRADTLEKVYSWTAPSTEAVGTLVVIGIANRIDLPERMIKLKKRNCEPVSVEFRSYNRDELIGILKATPACGLLDHPSIINLVARKVSASKGDVRLAISWASAIAKALAGAPAGTAPMGTAIRVLKDMVGGNALRGMGIHGMLALWTLMSLGEDKEMDQNEFLTHHNARGAEVGLALNEANFIQVCDFLVSKAFLERRSVRRRNLPAVMYRGIFDRCVVRRALRNDANFTAIFGDIGPEQ